MDNCYKIHYEHTQTSNRPLIEDLGMINSFVESAKLLIEEGRTYPAYNRLETISNIIADLIEEIEKKRGEK